jgi:protein phosphatase 1 regulatory subunit 7
MAIEIIDGCKIYVNGHRSVIINSDCIPKCMEVYKKYNLDGVAVSIFHDYKIQNVDFFREYPEVKHISISEGIPDISGINGLLALRSAIISGKNRRIDFSFFPQLEVFNADWSPYFENLDKCINLYSLSMHHYTPKSKDITGLSQLSWLSKLKINQSNISSFHGLEEFSQLEELQFNYCSKLEKLCCLEKSSNSIKSLICDYCKAIKNHDYVTTLKVLSTLAFNDCGYLPSIKFIKKISSLESFRFGDTDVIDGDMSPCIGLNYVYFSNKRHFSHKVEEINFSNRRGV